ncbi:hypothetical protein SDC9_192886 [bioreactor metagenome]|uniref:Uncharacterized protein n=1 Tax=bioreactor metagenome TaxID=1076179 RepID=A0A645I4E4_9ZZZZ
MHNLIRPLSAAHIKGKQDLRGGPIHRRPVRERLVVVPPDQHHADALAQYKAKGAVVRKPFVKAKPQRLPKCAGSYGIPDGQADIHVADRNSFLHIFHLLNGTRTCLPALERPPERLDIQLLHRHERRHDPLNLFAAAVCHHLGHFPGHNLPGNAKPVLQPATGLRFRYVGKLLPVLVNLLLVFAV